MNINTILFASCTAFGLTMGMVLVTQTTHAKNQQTSSIVPPKGYSIIDSAVGDLDGDGTAEMAVAYNTKKESEYGLGVERELILYSKKSQDADWRIWQRSKTALMSSEDGGMSGDPFEALSIYKGVLEIVHFGGSSWKWRETDKYRFQKGKFKLIGHTFWGGKLCEEWTKVDINLNTSKTIYHKEMESCDSGEQVTTTVKKETFYYRKLQPHRQGIFITLQNRNPKEIKMITPKYKQEIYVASDLKKIKDDSD